MKIQSFERGSLFWVKISPKAFKNECLGWESNFLKIKIKAIPAKGSANEELIAFLTSFLKIPKSKILIRKGQGSPIKQIQVEDISAEELEKKFFKALYVTL